MVRYILLTYPTVAQPKYQSWRSHIPPHHWAHHTETEMSNNPPKLIYHQNFEPIKSNFLLLTFEF